MFVTAAVSGSLGGGALLVGARSTTNVSVPGARPGMHVTVTPGADPGAGCWWGGWISANDIVTVFVAAVVAVTPNATTYAVKVEQ